MRRDRPRSRRRGTARKVGAGVDRQAGGVEPLAWPHASGRGPIPPVGGGGGGGGLVQPLGFIEIDATGARWVPLEPSRAELAIRALMLAAVLLPFGSRRGLIGRFLVLLIGQLIAGRISQPNLPPMDSFRSRVSA